MLSLTATQQVILDYLRRFHAEYDHLPSTREIQQHFHYSSQTAAMTHLRALCQHGALENVSTCTGRRLYRFVRTTH